MTAQLPEPMIWIRWIDSTHTSGWKPRYDCPPASLEDMMCESVGFLVHDTPHSLALIQSKTGSDDHDEIDAIMEIPKVAIQKVRYLSLGKVRANEEP